MSLDQANGPVLNVPFAFGLDDQGNQVPLVGITASELELKRGPTLNVPFGYGLDTANNVQVPMFGLHPDSPGGGGGGSSPTDAYRIQKLWKFAADSGHVVPETTDFQGNISGVNLTISGAELELATDLTLQTTIQWDTDQNVFVSGGDLRTELAGPHAYPASGTYEVGIQFNDASDNTKTNRQFRKSFTVTLPPLVISGFVRFEGLIDVAALFSGISNDNLAGTHIDWGDGTTTVVDPSDFSTIIRRYEAEGTYTVTVSEYIGGVASGRTATQAFTTTDLNPPAGGPSPLPLGVV